MKNTFCFETIKENELYKIEGGLVTTAPQLGIFVIAEWLKSLF